MTEQEREQRIESLWRIVVALSALTDSVLEQVGSLRAPPPDARTHATPPSAPPHLAVLDEPRFNNNQPTEAQP